MKCLLRGCLAIAATLCVQQSANALPDRPTLPPTAVASRLNSTVLVAPGHTIELDLPGSAPTSLSNARRETFGNGLVGTAARTASGNVRFYAMVSGDRILSADAYRGGQHYQLVNHQGRSYWVPASGSRSRGDALRTPTAPGAIEAPARVEAGVDGNYEVSVLVLYTPQYEQRIAPNLVDEEAQRLIFLASAYMETSAVPVRYSLAGTAVFTDTHEDSGFYDNLAALAASKNAASLRDRYAADLVVLMRSQDGNADLCGLSSGFNNFQHSDPPTDIDTARDAFNVVGIAPDASGGSACFDDTFAHELGHSLGGGHDYVGSAGFAYWKPYSHAAPCLDANGVRYFSMMWSLGVGPGGGRSELITNPRRSLDGVPCGIVGVEGVEASQADNARAMAEAAPYVAAYRSKSGTGAAMGGGAANSGSGGAWTICSSLLLGLVAWRRGRRGRPG